jgi:NAD(P)H-flavin reductase
MQCRRGESHLTSVNGARNCDDSVGLQQLKRVTKEKLFPTISQIRDKNSKGGGGFVINTKVFRM